MTLFSPREIRLASLLQPLLLSLLLLTAGCAGGSGFLGLGGGDDDAPEEAAPAASQLAVQQPFLVSGDDFREKKAEGGLSMKVDTGGREEAERTQVLLEERVSRLEKRAAGKGEVAAGGAHEANRSAAGGISAGPEASMADETPTTGGMRIKVGMLVDRRGVAEAGARHLSNAAYVVSVRFPVTPVSPKEIGEALARKSAADYGDLEAVAREIGIYPGVRMLILVDRFQLPAAYPGKVSADINVVDAGAAHRYPLPPMERTVNSEGDVEKFAREAMAGAFEQAVSRSALMPWFCRAFSSDGKTFYVNAGKRSGLLPGHRLSVVTGGKLVKAPSGIPAGWIPGRPTGTLRVDLNFGKDLSSCTLVQGNAPSPADLLVKN